MRVYEYVLQVKEKYSDNMRKFLRMSGQAEDHIDRLQKKLLGTTSTSAGLKNVWRRVARGADDLRNRVGRVIRPSERIRDVLQRIGSAGSEAFRRVVRQGGRLRASLQKVKSEAGGIEVIFRRLKRAAVGFLAVGAFAAFSNSAIQTAADVTGLENAVRAASGSVAEANANLAFLRNTSEDLGLNLAASSRGFKTLAGATRGTILQGEATRKIFKDVSTAVTVLGLSAEQSEGALLALSQMMSKGRVAAEELRGQLGERLPGAVQIAARAMGVTTAEFDKLMRAGLDASVFLPRFADQLRREFESKLPEAAQSMRANLNRISNEMLLFRRKFGEEFAPLLSPLRTTMQQVFGWIERNVFPVLHRFIGFILEVSQKIHLLNPALTGLQNAFTPLFVSLQMAAQRLGLFNARASAAETFLAVLSVAISKVTPILRTLSSWLGKVISFISKNITWIRRAIKFYIAARVGILAYNVALRAQAAILPALKAATFAYNAAVLVATRGIKGATVAMRAFNIATRLNPIGFVVGLLATAAVAFTSFGSSIDEVTRKQKQFNRELLRTQNLMLDGNQVLAKAVMGQDLSTSSLKELRAGLMEANEQLEAYRKNNIVAIQDPITGEMREVDPGGRLRNLLNARNRLQELVNQQERALGQDNTAAIMPGEVEQGINNITGGGGRVVNVNVSGVTFAENLEINVNSIEEGEDLEAQMQEWFTRILNGATFAGTQ